VTFLATGLIKNGKEEKKRKMRKRPLPYSRGGRRGKERGDKENPLGCMRYRQKSKSGKF